MCGKPNPGEAEECEHCGARLKPLEVGGSSEDSEKWLDRMREDVGEAPTSSEMGGEAVNEPDDTSSEGPDDLDFDKLRAEQTEEKLPQEAEPAKEDVPEWLQRIREKKAEEPKDLVESNEPAPEQALRAAAPPADEVGSETAGPAPEEELRAAPLQFGRKVSGYRQPPRANAPAFDAAVDEISEASQRLLDGLVSPAPRRDG